MGRSALVRVFVEYDRILLLPHGLHTDAPFVSEKDKNLVGWVIVGRSKEVELIPTANEGQV